MHTHSISHQIDNIITYYKEYRKVHCTVMRKYEQEKQITLNTIMKMVLTLQVPQKGLADCGTTL